jgi:beta-N-acetylhexosaminidase
MSLKNKCKKIGLTGALGLGIIVSFGFFKEGPDSTSKSYEKNAVNHKTLPQDVKHRDFHAAQSRWADSLLATMTLEEKIGQLFMVATFSNRNEQEYRKIEEQVRKFKLGGLIFFQGTPIQQAVLTNRYQAASRIPLMIGIDGEWGLGMRLDDAVSFPKQITLGATKDPEVVERMGYEIGLQCKRLGIHINFSPVVDINSNPQNPIINFRSFGQSKENVTILAQAYAKGMKKAGIMACAKHFPGHGDTDADSHLSMPVLDHSRKHLEEHEMYPFRQLIADSIAGIMTGHLYVPNLDNAINMPASVSKRIIKETLQQDLKFEGLTFTDALNMRGLTRYYPTGTAEVMAFEAGNDVLLQTGNVEVAFNKLKEKFLDSTLNIADLDIKVLKILRSKYWAGLNQYRPIDYNNISRDINNNQSVEIKKEIFRKAITIVKDDMKILPFFDIDTTRFASVAIGAKSANAFQENLSNYANFKHFTIPFKPSASTDWKWVADEASKYSVVVISVHEMHNLGSKNFGVTASSIDLIREIAQKTKVIVCAFGNPYSLKLFDEFKTLVCGYEDVDEAHQMTPGVLFGGNASFGKLPVSPTAKNMETWEASPSGNLGRLGYADAEAVGMNSKKLEEIDNIAQESIRSNVFPGCQILVARKGKVVFHKSYGKLRYGLEEPVTNNTLYDLASITKVAATLQAVMRLSDQNRLDVNKKASEYLPELVGTNKENLIIKDILLHQAGLKAFIPFWTRTKKANGSFDGDYYAMNIPESNLQVFENLYIKPSIKDSVFKWIIESPLSSKITPAPYVYSDLGLIMMQRVVEKITGQPLDEYVEQNIYQPLGMNSTLFNPLKRFSKSQIAPTEYDQTFRNTSIQGTVHDPNAALLGGVAGHAGLFSTAWDLAKLFQMNLQDGFYGGAHYLVPCTIENFARNTSVKSHRGIGWNKPLINDSSVASMASKNTFGHTGFTGTVVWVDPDEELVFIMLSNRVYPSVDNNKIIQYKTRRRVHEVIYGAINK